MIGKKIFCSVLTLAMIGLGASGAEKVKQIRYKQDDAQSFMVSKVYQLKYTQANDLTPFVLNAVKLYDVESKVERLTYKFRKEQYLVVTTPREMMPYVDDMVKKLDRPGVEDESGSVIEGTGIYRFAYAPKFRSSDEMLNILRNAVSSADGYAWRNAESNMLYWKDSRSDGLDVLIWAKGLDRPVPQVELTLKVYEVRDSDLQDLGIDYVAWKNGPGLNIFSAGMDAFSYNISEQLFNNLVAKGVDIFGQGALGGWGGFMVAPSFDFSFVRMLAQQGKATVAATGVITVINSYSGTYNVDFAPEDQNIVKDSKTDQTTVKKINNSSFSVKISRPVICFRQTGEKFAQYDGRLFDETTYAKMGGAIIFDYVASMNTPVEQNNFGDELTDASNISSAVTLNLGTEKLLGEWTFENEVEQVTGMPFLSDIPVFKYLVSTTTTIKTKTYFFVTVEGLLAHPDRDCSKWAGQVLQIGDIKQIAADGKYNDGTMTAVKNNNDKAIAK